MATFFATFVHLQTQEDDHAAKANLQLVKRSPHMAQVDFARICGTYLPTAAIEHLHPQPASDRSAGTAGCPEQKRRQN